MPLDPAGSPSYVTYGDQQERWNLAAHVFTFFWYIKPCRFLLDVILHPLRAQGHCAYQVQIH